MNAQQHSKVVGGHNIQSQPKAMQGETRQTAVHITATLPTINILLSGFKDPLTTEDLQHCSRTEKLECRASRATSKMELGKMGQPALYATKSIKNPEVLIHPKLLYY